MYRFYRQSNTNVMSLFLLSPQAVMGDVLPTYGTTDSSSGVNDGAHQEHFKQSFSIAEPYTSLHDDTTPLNRGGSTGLSAGVAGLLCCPRNKDSGNDGFKAVVLFMAVFAAGVTVALVVQVASGALQFMVLWPLLT